MKNFVCTATLLCLTCLTGLLPQMVRGEEHSAESPSATIRSSNGFKTVLEEWTDAARANRKVPVKLYLPEGVGPFPVVIFSHGLGGSREAAPYLGEYWARKGFAGVFVQHPGSDSSVWQSTERGQRMQALRAAANGRNLFDRGDDVLFILDELDRRCKTAQLKGKLDLTKIAVAGHSFGAGTSLLVAGQNLGIFKENPRYYDSRIKAAIYLCPPVNPLAKQAPQRAFGTIKIPGLLLTGTEDNSPIGETSAADRRIPFDGISAPHQYLVNFYGADHAVFGGGRAYRTAASSDEYHKMIEEVTGIFLSAALKSDQHAWSWFDDGGAAAYLNKKADFEKK